MFRKMRRFKQQISEEECREILKQEPRGVLSLIGDNGYPYGIPMDHWYCEEDGKLIFMEQRKVIRLMRLRSVTRLPTVFMTKASGKRASGL